MRTACLILATALLAVPAGSGASGSKAGGAICIAPFHDDPGHGPNMDLTGPGPESKYSFRVDHKPAVTVAAGEMKLIPDVPADRKVLVEIRLDGQPTESFRIDLRREEEHRLCLWLYTGYWHWVITTGDDRVKGCKCWNG